MKRKNSVRMLAALIASAFSAPLLAQADAATIVGKNDWLYFRWERIDPAHIDKVKSFTQMLKKANKVFADNGIKVLLTVTPLKMQVYPQHLPATFQLAPGMENNYARLQQELAASGVAVADQLTPFIAQAKQDAAKPLFLRLDSHWTPSGAFLAAQTIRTALDASPEVKKIWEGIPEVGFTLSPAPEPVPATTTDLLPTLPRGTPAPPPETIATFKVEKGASKGGDLMGDAGVPQITVIGSSFTHPATQYPDSLRYTLQRELLDISIPGRQGPWVGMENYVGSTAFQLHPPKLIIWEVPERDVVNPPDSPWRESHYKRDNDEWLLNLASQVANKCQPSPIGVKIGEVRLPGGAARIVDGGIAAGASQEDSFVEFVFDKPLDKLDFLWNDFVMKGMGRVRFEAIAANGKGKRWGANVPEEARRITLKAHAPEAQRGYARVRLYPGEGSEFALGKPQLCRHDAALLVRN